MPFILINQANLYYETFGKPASEPPVVLIHGATSTGRADWDHVASLLGQNHFVIVPDCRGHGKSTNPRGTYSFSEMADDIARLIGELGFSRAHVIGHSNGGNVALLVLMEHPEMVQSTILQAANAIVTDFLREREPVVFDPEYVAKNSLAWKAEMIALHGETHGTDYWRTLLQLTLAEIVSTPNYSPSDLSTVDRPVMVIQGEFDQVNSPDEQAQYIARHIPNAELWIACGAGHNVHDDMRLEWLRRVEDFMERHTEPANEILEQLAQEIDAGRRTPFRVRVKKMNTGLVLSGEVLDETELAVVRDRLSSRTEHIDTSHVRLLMSEKTGWALVRLPVSDLRNQPRRSSERLSQVLLGEPLRILDDDGDGWSRVRCVRDGYIGWVGQSTLTRCSQENVQEYQQSTTHVIFSGLLPAYCREQNKLGLPGAQIGILPFGVEVTVIDMDENHATIRLPDNQLWLVGQAGLLPLDKRPSLDKAGIFHTLDLLKRLIGTPYLSGGSSPFGYDCSGLSQAFLRFIGLNPRRDADMQYLESTPVDDKPEPGDLLFFSESTSPTARVRHAGITHVAIALNSEEVIHATGATQCVTINSLNPESPIYRAWLVENLVGIRRYV